MFIDFQGRRGAVLMLNTLFLAAACAGPEPGDEDPAQTAVDSSEITRLDDRIDPNARCTPFALQAIERSADVLSAVASSDALEACVVREVNDPITVSRGRAPRRSGRVSSTATRAARPGRPGWAGCSGPTPRERWGTSTCTSTDAPSPIRIVS